MKVSSDFKNTNGADCCISLVLSKPISDDDYDGLLEGLVKLFSEFHFSNLFIRVNHDY